MNPFRKLFGARGARKPGARRRPVPALGMERLEDRTVPAIAGKVFNDFNDNGVQDTANAVANAGGVGNVGQAIDAGIAGVTVNAFDSAGALAATAVTNASGAYSLATAAGQYRVEFQIPVGYQAGAAGTGSATSRQFLADGQTANLGVFRPSDFTYDNPLLTVNCFVFGDQINGANKNRDVLVSFAYSAGTAKTDTAIADYKNPGTHALTVSASKVGSTWGQAYDKNSGQLYLSAFTKKHAGWGPGGNGAVYKVDATTGAVSTFADLNAIFGAGTTGANFRSAYAGDANYLSDSGNTGWDAVGKNGLGGTALSEDGKTLYVVNLADRMVYALPTTGPLTVATVRRIAIPVAPGATGVTGANPLGDLRPFALTEYRGELYVGMVNTAENTGLASDLKAYVYKLTDVAGTLAFGAAPAFQFALNYTRNQDLFGGALANWRAWSPTFQNISTTPPIAIDPQPWLTGIAFDANGNIALGVVSRDMHQLGNNTPDNPAQPGTGYYGYVDGDTLRAFANTPGDVSGGWTFESNARGPNGEGAGPQNNNAGPGGGEFYYQDHFQYPPYHPEVGLGGVLQVPGFPDVATTVIDPSYGVVPANNGFLTAGVHWYNNSTGATTKGYQLLANDPGSPPPLFGKAGGLGSLAALVAPAPVEIGNRVWLDANGNGIQDAGEAALAGVTVKLCAPGGALLATAVTDANGNYIFSSGAGTSSASMRYGLAGLTPNTNGYVVKLDKASDYAAGGPLAGLFVSPTGAGADPLNDSDGVKVGAIVQAVVNTGAAGANDHALDFGFAPVGLGDYVFKDNNGDGIQNAGDTPIVGATVRLYAADGITLLATAATDAAGKYLFSTGPGASTASAVYGLNLSPSANYVVKLDKAADYAAGGPLANLVPTAALQGGDPALDSNGAISGTAVVTAATTPTAGIDPRYDFGFVPAVAIGDRVWFDGNANGVQDAGEGNLAGVQVALCDAGGGVVAHATTDANGNYLFTSALGASSASVQRGLPLVAGANYTVKLDRPADYAAGGPLYGLVPSPTGQGTAATDSNGVLAGGFLTAGVVAPAGADPTIDFGLAPLAIGDYVFKDNNGDGIQNAGDAPLVGVTVKLCDSAGNVVATAITDAAGKYLFASGPGTSTASAKYGLGLLPNANYMLKLDNPANALPGGPLAGLAPTQTGQGTAVTDSDGVLAGGVVKATATTPAFGADPSYDFGFVTALSIGDRVWLDKNGDGIQTPGEPGLAGVTVKLCDGAGNIVATAVTDASGNYLFSGALGTDSASAKYNLILLPNAPYAVKLDNPADFGPSGPLAGLVVPAALQGGDPTKDSDGVLSGGAVTANVVTPASGPNPTIDFGFAPVGIGDLVFRDANGNGVQDAGDTPLAGVTVKLCDANNAVVATAVTDANGNYLFASGPGVNSASFKYGLPLQPGGAYRLKIDNPADYAAGGPLAGLTATSALTGGNPAVDSNGVLAGSIVQAAAVAPSVGLDRRYDFGFRTPTKIGDFVWVDQTFNGVQDAGEPVLAGVHLSLYDPGGNLLGVAVTDAAGYYSFSNGIGTSTASALFGLQNLNPNLAGYTLRLETPADFAAGGPLAGKVLTTSFAGADPALDSNAIVQAGTILATAATPAAGAADLRFDFGFRCVADLKITKVASVAQAAVGDTITYTVTLDNLGPHAGTGIVANVPLPAAVQFVSAAAPAGTSYNSATGKWTVGNLAANGQLVLTIQAKVVQAGTIDCAANVAGNEYDSNPANNDSAAQFGAQQPETVGDRVMLDANGNGIQDAGDLPLAGVTVMLCDKNGNLLSSAVTDANGNYLFTSSAGTDTASAKHGVLAMTPGTNGFTIKLGNPADYLPGGPLGGLTPSPALQGGDPAADSNGIYNPPSGFIQTMFDTPPAAGSNLTLDFLLRRPTSAGDFVWNDLNGNGVQDPGEPGIAGVTVKLCAPNGTEIASAVTDANGGYLFSNGIGVDTAARKYLLAALQPNTPGYVVKLENPADYAAGGPLAPFVRTGDGLGGDPAKDSNGVPGAAIPGGKGVRTNFNAGPPGADGTGTDFGFAAPVAIGRRLWIDANGDGLRDPSEPGIAGVTVTLCAPDGTEIAAVVTDANGDYLFTNARGTSTTSQAFALDALRAGVAGYMVKLSNPADFAAGGPLHLLFPTQPNAGTDPLRDSNGVALNPDGTPAAPTAAGSAPGVVVKTTLGALPPGSAGVGTDFGLRPVTDVKVENALDTDKASIGDVLSWTVVVTNNGPSPATGVVAMLMLPPGVEFVGGTPGQGTYDPASGKWTIGNLPPGGVATFVVQAKVVRSGALAFAATVAARELELTLANNAAAAAAAAKLTAGQISKQAFLASTPADVAVGAAAQSVPNAVVAGNAAWLMQLYRDLLGREIDDVGYAGYLAYLAEGHDRHAVVASIVDSEEYRGRAGTALYAGLPTADLAAAFAALDAAYPTLLHRPADAASRDAYAGRLKKDGTLKAVLEELLSSDEYYADAA